MKISVNRFAKVPQHLTTDPANKRGQIGRITDIDGDVITLEFTDNVRGKYLADVLEPAPQPEKGQKWTDSTDERRVVTIIGKTYTARDGVDRIRVSEFNGYNTTERTVAVDYLLRTHNPGQR